MEHDKYISQRYKWCFSCCYVAVPVGRGLCPNCGENVMNPPYKKKNCFPNCDICRRFEE